MFSVSPLKIVLQIACLRVISFLSIGQLDVFKTNEIAPNQHCFIKTSKWEVRGNVSMRPSVTGYENLCKK